MVTSGDSANSLLQTAVDIEIHKIYWNLATDYKRPVDAVKPTAKFNCKSTRLQLYRATVVNWSQTLFSPDSGQIHMDVDRRQLDQHGQKDVCKIKGYRLCPCTIFRSEVQSLKKSDFCAPVCLVNACVWLLNFFYEKHCFQNRSEKFKFIQKRIIFKLILWFSLNC